MIITYLFLRTSLFSVLLLFFFVPSVYGDTVLPPCSYRAFSNNGKYFFVMLAPQDKRDVECLGSDEKRSEAKKIRKEFPNSGLYEMSSSKPLWKVSWYSYRVYVSDDGNNIIREGPWASNATDEAFSLIQNGQVKKTYKVSDLISAVESLPHSTSHFEWKKEFKINDAMKTFSVTTLENKTFVFDLGTGEIISKPADNSSNNNSANYERKNNKSFCGGIILLAGLVLSFSCNR